MPVDLPRFLTRHLDEIGERGMHPRRLIVVVDLPAPAPGGNLRVVDSTHHLNFEDVLTDPGVLGAIAQLAVGKTNA